MEQPRVWPSPHFYLTWKHISVLIKGLHFGFLPLSAKSNSNRSQICPTDFYSPETTTCFPLAVSSIIYLQGSE